MIRIRDGIFNTSSSNDNAWYLEKDWSKINDEYHLTMGENAHYLEKDWNKLNGWNLTLADDGVISLNPLVIEVGVEPDLNLEYGETVANTMVTKIQFMWMMIWDLGEHLWEQCGYTDEEAWQFVKEATALFEEALAEYGVTLYVNPAWTKKVTEAKSPAGFESEEGIYWGSLAMPSKEKFDELFQKERIQNMVFSKKSCIWVGEENDGFYHDKVGYTDEPTDGYDVVVY